MMNKTLLAILFGAVDGGALVYIVMKLRENAEAKRVVHILEREYDLTGEAIKLAVEYAHRAGIQIDEKAIEDEFVKRWKKNHK